MSYTPRSLFRLLEEMDGHRLLLPHIQRPFVWEPHQTERLFDSLMRDYPIQTFLLWRTKEAIRARRFMPVVDHDIDLSTLYDLNRSAAGVEKTFVLDGQTAPTEPVQGRDGRWQREGGGSVLRPNGANGYRHNRGRCCLPGAVVRREAPSTRGSGFAT